MSAPARRKLAAIVFADIAGYTDKTQRDEAGTLTLRDRIERLIKASTLGHNGRVVKTLGDGAMLEFASAVEAVSCAIDIQDQMDVLNADLEMAEPIALRVGVHVGDVVEEDDDLYGNAVNIASRVLGMAKPGGICITREVYVQIRPILKLNFEPVAGASSDRLPEPVEVFAIIGGEDLHPAQSSARPVKRNPVLLGAVILGCLAVFAALYAMLDSARNDPAEKPANQVHRILLPDWVTPGEWFMLDAGKRAPQLSVYFGNRRADTRIENGQLFVRTPIDLPTAQTAISVFEGKSDSPLMNQQTQVIKYGSLAMNSDVSSNRDPIRSEGPEVDISTEPPRAEGKADLGKNPDPKVNLSGKLTSPAGKPAAGAVPSVSLPKFPASPPVGGLVVRVPEVPGVENYDAMVNLVQDGDFKFERIDMKSLQDKMGPWGDAFKSIGLAQGGSSREARRTIESTRVHLKSLSPDQAKEVEAMLKAAEAFLDEPSTTGGRPGSRRHSPKWAEAFAYSMNRGTRTMPGLLMIDTQLRTGQIEEAKRAIAAMKSRPDLTPNEKKALEGLEHRIEKGKASPDAPPRGGTTVVAPPKPTSAGE